MEREIKRKVFFLEEYKSKESMLIEVNTYIKKMKVQYPNLIITKEFYKGQNILVRVTKMDLKNQPIKETDKQMEIEGAERIIEIGARGKERERTR